jgi:hypothetical protein
LAESADRRSRRLTALPTSLWVVFAIDGVKLPSTASKHSSGTRADFLGNAEKLERVARQMLDRHRVNDDVGRDSAEDKVAARVERMTQEAKKYDLVDNQPQGS